jgi:maleylpyruvate isomerase
VPEVTAAGRPDAALRGCREAQSRLEHRLLTVTDADLRRPSLLPEWTVAHVLAHLARNADSVVGRLRGCLAGEIVDQYEGGSEERAKAIETSSTQQRVALLEDVRLSAAAIEEVVAEMPDDAWGRLSRSVSGNTVPASRVVRSRWWEVEIHHVDLGLGYTAIDWPMNFVLDRLPGMLDALADRADPTALLAWTLGRGGPPELRPWD